MDLFIYGTLQSPRLLAAVSGRDNLQVEPAILDGYNVGAVADEVVPFVYRDAEGRCTGQLVTGVTSDAWGRLDAYEGAFGYSLIDVVVDTPAGPRSAKMYFPPDNIPKADEPWSFDAWNDAWEGLAVRAVTDLFRSEPALTAQEIRIQWKMIQSRAWSKTLAVQNKAEFQVRKTHKPADVEIVDQATPAGDFFRFDKTTLCVRKFDGGMSEPITREALISVDAAFVLPYDPIRDRVLLLEQFRLGAALREDQNPWLLEPVAGMIDVRETPIECAAREAIEEAHLTSLDIRHVSSVYSSPGTSTDFHHLFVGLCDLPDDHPRFGGLAAENEDIRLHILPRAQAMDLVQSGEINVGPLVTMLMWLQVNLDSLRAKG